MTTWNLSGTRHHVLICNGGSCMRRQGEEVTQAIRAEIAVQGADAVIHTTRTRCNGRCEDACVIAVYPEGIWYQGVTPELGERIVREHLLQGEPLVQHIAFTYEQEKGFTPTGLASPGIQKTGSK
ncbi:(2Fe-2S) ferredoxin domain-containing protein [Paenibacillus sp. y28]|uniref:(2Fe-2S) ferredoxin domain-containing protein n=1 Tax=Paenibacillus sp. y28 TaxID=3129110 RepID=UPI00301A8C0E